MNPTILSRRAASRCTVALWFVAVAGCSNSGSSADPCVHNLLEVPTPGTSDYVLYSDETGCDEVAHSDEVLLYLVKRGETRRIPVFEYIPSTFRARPHATWVSPGKLRIDFEEVDSILKTYKVDEVQVDVHLNKRPHD
jgi:hypothetical protein